MQQAAIYLFVCIFILVLSGYPVALVLGGLSTLFGLYYLGVDFFLLLPSRFMGVVGNYVLLAVPLFVFMGVMLERSGIAKRLLESMARLFGKSSGGLAISTIIVGALLAASTGIVGATVITMGLISLPVMLENNYDVRLATGSILSAGTLGQIIPPSIVLVLLGSVMNISVGDLFAAAIAPSILLVVGYLMYILIIAKIQPDRMPPMDVLVLPAAERQRQAGSESVECRALLTSLFAPLLLIVLVLGAIFTGVASPTEAAGLGALGALLLTAFHKKLTWNVLRGVVRETAHVTSMVFFILLGATTFALVFRGLGGDVYLTAFVTSTVPSPAVFLLVVMALLFVAGFFIDFIEIIFIFVPVIAPIFQAYDFDMVWIAVLLALNLQTSFLTPPFGFALFYLRGVAPETVKTKDMYRGVIPFLLIQLIVLAIVICWPGLLIR